MALQERKYRITEATVKERQLSSLFTIISNNLLIASEILTPEYKMKHIKELEPLSKETKTLAEELLKNESNKNLNELAEKISFLKNKILPLILNLTEELNKLNLSSNGNEKAVKDLILAKRLLRETQRGLATV